MKIGGNHIQMSKQVHQQIVQPGGKRSRHIGDVIIAEGMAILRVPVLQTDVISRHQNPLLISPKTWGGKSSLSPYLHLIMKGRVQRRSGRK